MKYLGIDFGAKRVGIALSDDEGRIAFPRTVLPNAPSLAQDIVLLAKKEGINVIVIGESLDYKRQPNPIMKKIIPFKHKLETQSQLPVVFEPEVLSSKEAARIQGENDMHDASAAAIILQSYIDRSRR